MIVITANHHVSFSIVPTLSSSLSPPPSFLIDHHHLSLNAAYDGLITGRGVHNLLEVPGVIEGISK